MKTTFLVMIFSLLAVSVSAQSMKDVEGEYVLQELNRVKQGDLLRYPFRGVSVTYQVKLENDQTAQITQNTYERGRRRNQQVFRVRLEEKQGRIEFTEIWESGELITDGYIVGNQFVMNSREKVTNYLLQKEIAVK